jgi:hypothetical protein
MIIFSAAPEMGKLYTRRALGPQFSPAKAGMLIPKAMPLAGGGEAHPPL